MLLRSQNLFPCDQVSLGFFPKHIPSMRIGRLDVPGVSRCFFHLNYILSCFKLFVFCLVLSSFCYFYSLWHDADMALCDCGAAVLQEQLDKGDSIKEQRRERSRRF